MLEEKTEETGKPSTPEFILLPDDTGKEVKIPKTAIENLEWDLPERGEIKKEKIGELAKRGMRQDEFSRKMTEAQKIKEEAEQLKEVLANAEEKTDLGESGKPQPEDSGELPELSLKEDEILEGNPELIKKLVGHSNAQARYIKNLEKKQKDKEAQQAEVTKKQAEETKKREEFVKDLQPALKAHPWLNKDDPSFDEAKCALFTERLRIDTDKSLKDISDWVEDHFKGRSQKDVDSYLKEKEEQQKKPSFRPGVGTALPPDIKLESKDLSDAIHEASEKFKVPD